MVKTPKRRKKTEEEEEELSENGKAQETTPSRRDGISPPASRLRSRKKRRRGDDESDDNSMTTDDDEETSNKPRAASKRGRRKKTNDDSSRNTTDNEEEQPPAKRRRGTTTRGRRKTATKNKASKQSDDESMTEASEENDDESMTQDDEEDASKKYGGQNGFKSSSVAALPTVDETQEEEEETNGSSKPAALGHISKLRMPSKHTPGKLQTTAPAPGRGATHSRRLQFGAPNNTNQVLNEVPPAAAGGISTATTREESAKSPQGVDNAELTSILTETAQEEEQVSFTAQVYQVATTSLETMVYSIGEVATSLVVPQMQEDYVDENDEHVQVSSPLLTRSYVWFILLLLLQLLCWNPIVSTVNDTSDFSLGVYKTLVGTRDLSTAVTVSKEKLDLQELQEVSRLLESLEQDANMDNEMAFVEKKLVEIRGRMRERHEALEDWKDGLEDVESALHGLATAESMDNVPRLFFRANEILGFFKDMVPPDLSTEILDTTYVFLWEIASSANCKKPSDASDDSLLTLEMLQMGLDELRQMYLVSASEIMSDKKVSSSLRDWIRDAVPKNATSQSEEEEKESIPMNGLTQDMARDVIAEFLEKERADQLGVVDYASILAGATVIRVGDRATSPSLVDSLPLLNRLMEHARLRFYGYGPEAALTPTFPFNALGQCWAFDKNPTRNGGRYATLTVQLGEPVFVTQVVIEHAPKELTDQPETALRSFRIFGFEDEDASDYPWPLGSFEYDIGKLLEVACPSPSTI